MPQFVRRYAQTHMNVVNHQMAFDYLALSLLRQFPKYLSKIPAQRSVYRFLATLRYKHHVIFAIPPCMTQALILFHLETPSLVERQVSKRLTYRSNLGESSGRA